MIKADELFSEECHVFCASDSSHIWRHLGFQLASELGDDPAQLAVPLGGIEVKTDPFLPRNTIRLERGVNDNLLLCLGEDGNLKMMTVQGIHFSGKRPPRSQG